MDGKLGNASACAGGNAGLPNSSAGAVHANLCNVSVTIVLFRILLKNSDATLRVRSLRAVAGAGVTDAVATATQFRF